MYRNGFGYADPTAFKALSNIRREEKRRKRTDKSKLRKYKYKLRKPWERRPETDE